jgi:hypothetical protein
MEFVPFYSVFYPLTNKGNREIETKSFSRVLLKRLPNLVLTSLFSISFLNLVGFGDYVREKGSGNLGLKYKKEVVRYFGGENGILDSPDERSRMYMSLGLKEGEKIPFSAWKEAYEKFVKHSF